MDESDRIRRVHALNVIIKFPFLYSQNRFNKQYIAIGVFSLNFHVLSISKQNKKKHKNTKKIDQISLKIKKLKCHILQTKKSVFDLKTKEI